MGRLFWKFFLAIWLFQMAGMLGVGTIFWLEHRQHDAQRMTGAPESAPPGQPPPPEENRQAHLSGPDSFHEPHRPGKPPHDGPPHGPGPHIPWLPFFGALLASLVCAIGLAWYFSKPIRHLRKAFDAAADGNLDIRIGHEMEGRRDELADLGRDFDRMTERLGSLMNAQRRLLHDVSHEMRSPLARLQAAIGLLRQQPGRFEDSLLRIERESERMDRLIGELLTLSRLDAGVNGQSEHVDIKELLNDIVEDARFEGAERHIIVDYVASDLPDINANAELLHRAIENIVRNALRHSPEGEAIRVEAGCRDKLFQLAVIDHGPGVPEADLERIFNPFFRGPSAVSGEGYGLGLAIAKRVIASLRGRIVAENRQGGGLVVRISLDLP